MNAIEQRTTRPTPRLHPAIRRALPYACFLFFLAAAVSPASAQVSLSTIITLAQKNSTSVRTAAADLQKAEAVLAESKDVYIPNLVLGSGIGPPSIGFTFSQPSIASAAMQSLAFSRSQGSYIRAAKAGIDAASLSLKDAREQVAYDASANYIELDAVSRELETLRQGSESASRLMQIEEQRQQAGVDPLSAVLQARLTVAQLKLNRLHLESRAATLIAQLASLTGLPAASIRTDSSSIPPVPEVHADQPSGSPLAGVQAAQAQARAHELQAKGDWLATTIWPQIGFGAQYNRDATSLNNYNQYFGRIDPQTGQQVRFKADNFSAGFTIQIPLFDRERRAKSRESAAEALRGKVEAEQAQHQNDIQVATLDASIRELDALAEVASLKQQISAEQLKAVQSQLQYGNGAGSEPGATPQLSPKAEQLARIDQSQKAIDSLDAGFDLAKARLGLLRALGHMEDWLDELREK